MLLFQTHGKYLLDVCIRWNTWSVTRRINPCPKVRRMFITWPWRLYNMIVILLTRESSQVHRNGSNWLVVTLCIIRPIPSIKLQPWSMLVWKCLVIIYIVQVIHCWKDLHFTIFFFLQTNNINLGCIRPI